MTRRAFDNYSTDPGLASWAVKRAASIAVLPDGGVGEDDQPTILEPCCGNDAPFASVGAAMGMMPFGYDIRRVIPDLWEIAGPGMGMMCWECVSESFPRQDGVRSGYDIIATNPPFNIGEEIIRRSLALLNPCGCAAFLTKMAFLSTQKRSQLFVERPPLEVWILRARPSFTGDGATDIAQEYAFTFWVGKELERFLQLADGVVHTQLYWLDNAPLMEKGGKRKRVRIEKEASDV